MLLKRWYSVLAHATSWHVGRIVFVFKIVWYSDPPPIVEAVPAKSSVFRIARSPPTAEKPSLRPIEHIHRHISKIREKAGLPYQPYLTDEIELTYEQVTEEEFGPLFDETWDEE